MYEHLETGLLVNVVVQFKNYNTDKYNYLMLLYILIMINIQKNKSLLNRRHYKTFIYSHTGGTNNASKFSCYPNNVYNNICKVDKKGIYKSKKSCINECETKYINRHLIKSNIKGESIIFYLFIKEIIKKEKMDVYIKGGNVLGLYILKMIYNKHKNNVILFKKIFNKFLKLNLMKDWDFAAYTKKNNKGNCTEITAEYRDKLNKIAKKYKLVPRAKTFILYQTHKPLLIDDKAFFEISILDSNCFSLMELPMTTMKIKININNLKYIYMLSKSFLSHTVNNEVFDFDILKKILSKLNVIVHPHKNGLYNPKNKFDTGNLTPELISFINKFTRGDKSLSQFLITHLQDPYRLLYRLPEKNIPKTNKISNFIKSEITKAKQSWLIQPSKIIKIVETFTQKLGNKLLHIYNNGSIYDVNTFMKGVKFTNRQLFDHKNYSADVIQLLNNILKQIIDKMNKDKIIAKTDNISDIITFINFFKNI